MVGPHTTSLQNKVSKQKCQSIKKIIHRSIIYSLNHSDFHETMLRFYTLQRQKFLYNSVSLCLTQIQLTWLNTEQKDTITVFMEVTLYNLV
jgi:hypothetical protein